MYPLGARVNGLKIQVHYELCSKSDINLGPLDPFIQKKKNYNDNKTKQKEEYMSLCFITLWSRMYS